MPRETNAGGKFELKPLAKESTARALEKAERYRLLNEPFFAESICLDVLAVEPENVPARVCYVLALADQFASPHGPDHGVRRALEAVAKLPSEYERCYYAGIVHERRAVAYAESGGMSAKEAAWEHLVDAMELYEQSMPLRPAGNDDPILRYNTCVRLIDAHRLSAPSRDRHEYPLE